MKNDAGSARKTLPAAELETSIARRVIRLANGLGARGWRLTTAESCTGGWISKACTDQPGSSTWFDRGFVTYSDKAKCEMLGVDPGDIARYGAVSRTVAEGMAGGALQRAGADVAIAVTGVAGPDGGTADKPVGTVWFAWRTPGQPARSEGVRFTGDRESIRRQTVDHALAGLETLLLALH